MEIKITADSISKIDDKDKSFLIEYLLYSCPINCIKIYRKILSGNIINSSQLLQICISEDIRFSNTCIWINKILMNTRKTTIKQIFDEIILGDSE